MATDRKLYNTVLESMCKDSAEEWELTDWIESAYEHGYLMACEDNGIDLCDQKVLDEYHAKAKLTYKESEIKKGNEFFRNGIIKRLSEKTKEIESLLPTDAAPKKTVSHFFKGIFSKK